MARKTKTVEAVKPATIREVREWAGENGFEVKARGKLKNEVVEAFTSATGRPLATAE